MTGLKNLRSPSLPYDMPATHERKVGPRNQKVVRRLCDAVRRQFSYILVIHCDDSYLLSTENLHLSIETGFKSKSALRHGAGTGSKFNIGSVKDSAVEGVRQKLRFLIS